MSPHDARSAVLLHGVQSCRLSWWRIQQDLEAANWRVHALDMLGHGRRAAEGPARLTVRCLADDVRARLPERPDVVVGHSLGAIVALTAAAQDPGFADTIVLEDPPGLGSDLDPVEVARSIEAGVEAVRADAAAFVEDLSAAHPRWSRRDAEHFATSSTTLDVERVTGMLRSDTWDVRGLVARCPVPVHLLLASEDSALRDPDRAAVLQVLPAGRVGVVEAGHSIHRDQPEQFLSHVLTAFAAMRADLSRP